MLSEALVLDSGEYLVTSASQEELPGHVRVRAFEARVLVREWAQLSGVRRTAALCHALELWRSTEPPSDLEACLERLESCFDDHCPSLALHFRMPAEVALDMSPVEEPTDLQDLAESAAAAAEPDTHWVELTFHDADGNPLANVDCRIERPDGIVHDGRTNAAGTLWVGDISVAGACRVSFPELEAYVRDNFRMDA